MKDLSKIQIQEGKKVHFIDCGANIGSSVQWALKHFDIARIDCFEPQEENFIELKENAIKQSALYPSAKIFLNKEAVWINNNIRTMYMQKWGARSGSSLIFGKSSTFGKDSLQLDCEKVKCIDIAKWLEGSLTSEYFNIFKLNVEGAEYTIIPHLMQNKNVMDLIDYWFVDFHSTKIPSPNLEAEKEFRETVTNFSDWNDADYE